ncbi:hypothetical protein [Cesiribacter sp. SM1]|uniref:hypothetical protein n=1 Tax=Cesiribacter sp. SM1 TaxID=2861196 RepID=UPI001CD3528E|nr:hypothetical protein [Cesiribacter sp. SM1]
MRNVNTIAVLQGIFWAATGIWPMIHLPSFLWVTGPKEDIWLLYTVSVLILVIGLLLSVAGFRKTVTLEIKWLGIGGALGLTAIDIIYSTRDVIADIYRYDAVAETIIILLWLWAGTNGMARLLKNDSSVTTR